MKPIKVKALQTLAFGAALLLLPAATASADVQLTMQNGRVTIIARDATVRQILTEWARVGHTKIVNVERIPGGPVTLELNNMAEAQALEILLRAMSGYIAAPRPVEATTTTNLSRFDRIIVMPTLASARPPASAAPPPVFQQTPQVQHPPQPADDDADNEQPAPNVPMPPSRGPVFNTFPQQSQVVSPQQMPNVPPQVQPPPTPTFSSPQPTAPGGVSVPGMIAPPPPQPGQVQPGQPGVPVRRPGGPDHQ